MHPSTTAEYEFRAASFYACLVSIDVDYLIIGGGAMGSAAAHSLAARGREVLLLEQYAPGHLHGASHGATRNFNPAYAETPYVRLLQRANHLWDEIAQAGGTELLNRTGLVNHGDPAGQRQIQRSLGAAGFDCVTLSIAEAEERFAGMKFETEALYIPAGGQINADLAVSTLQRLALNSGATIHHTRRVSSLQVISEELVSIQLEDPAGSSTLRARHVIVTAGAWTRSLLGEAISLPRIHVTEEHPVHFTQTPLPVRWPGFNHSLDPARDTGSPVYGPIYGMHTPGEGIKVGWHGSGRIVDPDARPHELVDEQIRALQAYAARWLPGVDPERFETVSCTYSNTEDEDFILDRFGPITVGAGFSGHGFKFVPAIGEHLADLATGACSTEPTFAANRKITRPVFLERRHQVGLD